MSNPADRTATGNMTPAERTRAERTEGGTGNRNTAPTTAAATTTAAPAGETDTQRRERERREAATAPRTDTRAARNDATPDPTADRRARRAAGDRDVVEAGGRPSGVWPHVQTSQDAASAGFDVTRDVAGNLGSMTTAGGPGEFQPGSREANAAATDGTAPAGTGAAAQEAPATGVATGNINDTGSTGAGTR